MSNIIIKHQCYRDEQSNEATRDCLLQLGQPHEMILINISPFQTPPLRQPTSDNQSSTLNRIWRTTKDRGRIIWRIIPNPARIKNQRISRRPRQDAGEERSYSSGIRRPYICLNERKCPHCRNARVWSLPLRGLVWEDGNKLQKLLPIHL